MAYPAGVITRSIIVGDSLAVESGTGLTVRATLRSSRGLVWVATGERAVSAPEVKESAAAGDAVTFTPPVTDQAGWRDLATGALIDVSAPGSHTHTYTIELVTRRGERPVDSRIIGPFPLPTGDGSPVDADLLIEADSVPGLLVSVPDSWTAQIEAVSDGIPAAVADYLTANPPSGSPDATTLTKGIVRLAGDLSGTADAPTVPGLASKVETTDLRLTNARPPTAHTHDDRYYTEAETDSLLSGKAATGHDHAGTYAPALGADDNYVTDAEKAALHTHPAVIAQGATAAAARAAIGAGTSSLVIGTAEWNAKAGNYEPDLSGLVPTSRTVAGKALTGNITLAAADLTDFTEASQDVVGAMVAAAGGTYNDAGGSITLPTGGGGGSSTQVDIYYAVGAPGSQSSYTWTKPAGAKRHQFIVVSGGGGGGAGYRGAAGTIRGGGAGGGSAALSILESLSASLPATVTVLVGKGGAGGAAAASDSSAGGAGGNGGRSELKNGGARVLLNDHGSGGAAGAAGSIALGGGGGYYHLGSAGVTGGHGVAAGTSGGSAGEIGFSVNPAAGGGGGGGGITAANVTSSGGAGSNYVPLGSVDSGSSPLGYVGFGGTGGASSITAAGATGGAGGLAGAGGGGGGASLNGYASGAGGNGGDGIVIITTWF